MKTPPSNIYEADDNKLSEEADRLSSFDLPTQISIKIIGPMAQGLKFLDVGAGPNTGLYTYVNSWGGIYTALDKNEDFLNKQKQAGAKTIKGDIRDLSFDDELFDITHVRFVISHLGSEKQQAINEVNRITKSKGRVIFLDYDWTTAKGSDAFDKLKDFMINGGFLFDADYGAQLEAAVKKTAADDKIDVVNLPPTKMTDYSQILKLREAGMTDLRTQGKDQSVDKWNKIIDDLQREASSSNPPGFYFPGIVAVILTKS